MTPSATSPRFRLVKKIALIAGGGIAAILFAAIVAIYGISIWKLSARHEIVGLALRLAPAPSMVKEGERLAHVNGCFGCHGDDLAGHLFVDRPFIGRLSGHNLTRIVPQYSDQQLTVAIRGGIKSDGTGNIFMPSHAMVRLADADIAAIIAYLRTVERRPDAVKDTSLGLLPRALIAIGMIPIEPEVIDLNELGPRERPSEPDALGRYLARTACAMCHGLDLHGEDQVQSPDLYVVLRAYSLADFRTLLSTGIATGGRNLGLMTEVAKPALRYMSDDEVAAVYAHLSRPEAATHP